MVNIQGGTFSGGALHFSGGARPQNAPPWLRACSAVTPLLEKPSLESWSWQSHKLLSNLYSKQHLKNYWTSISFQTILACHLQTNRQSTYRLHHSTETALQTFDNISYTVDRSRPTLCFIRPQFCIWYYWSLHASFVTFNQFRSWRHRPFLADITNPSWTVCMGSVSSHYSSCISDLMCNRIQF